MEASQTKSSVSWFKFSYISETDSGSITSFKVRLNTQTNCNFKPCVCVCMIWECGVFSDVKILTVEPQWVSALAPLDTAHSTIILHWVTEDMCVCYSLTECYRPNSADSRCGISDRHFVTRTVWFNTDVCSAILLAVISGLLFIITRYMNISGTYY